MTTITRLLRNVKVKILKWCMKYETVQIGKLIQEQKDFDITYMVDNNDKLKFIASCSLDNYAVKTHKGFKRILNGYKTVPYVLHDLCLENGKNLKCADDHIVISSDGKEVFVKDLKVGDMIKTDMGDSKVKSLTVHDDYHLNMYDIEIDDYEHLYYTNGILSHNTETTSAFLLWYAIFNDAKTVLIVSNKSRGAMEIISKIQNAYEELPFWLKPAVDDTSWNKHVCAFQNKSRIEAQATSADSGRGLAISLLYCLDGEDSMVEVLDTETGEIENISMQDLYKKMELEENI